MKFGLLAVKKPSGITSFECVNQIKKILNTKKVGHTGTLDPLATGLLIVCVDEATKLVPFLENDTKEYVCEMILGYQTDTFDITGNVINEANIQVTDSKIITVINSFIGEMDQVVPLYSAVKVDGKALYRYARSGLDVKLPSKKITIYSISDIEIIREEQIVVKFKTKVSKGTYIRRLVDDIGLKLKTYATMKSLNRIKVGTISIDEAYALDDIKMNNYNLILMEDALPFNKYEIINPFYQKLISNGVKLTIDEVVGITNNQENIIAFTINQKLKAIYEFKNNNYEVLRVWK